MEDLSPRQREILTFIATYIDQRGIAPTFRDIGDALNIKSTNGVADHIKALEKKGYLERGAGPGAARSLRLSSLCTGEIRDAGVVSVPVIGRVAAGQPTLAQENWDASVRIDSTLVPAGKACFALRVHGESMIEDGILDGDVVIVQEQDSARNGEVVVVRVGEDATVKRFFREGRRIRLQPANSAMEPIYVDGTQGEVQVLGKVISLVRPHV